jgi:hypothetical protein
MTTLKNCIMLTRGEDDFSLSTMDGYAIVPAEVFVAMGGTDHPAYTAGLARARQRCAMTAGSTNTPPTPPTMQTTAVTTSWLCAVMTKPTIIVYLWVLPVGLMVIAVGWSVRAVSKAIRGLKTDRQIRDIPRER